MDLARASNKRYHDHEPAICSGSDNEQPTSKRCRLSRITDYNNLNDSLLARNDTTDRMLPCPPLSPGTSGQLQAALSSLDLYNPHQNSQSFDIFHALLEHPDIALYFTRFVELPALINLHSISKPFHRILSTRFTAVVLGQIAIHAPLASECWPWRMYRDLCMRDPGMRVLKPNGKYGQNDTVKPADIEEVSLSGNGAVTATNLIQGGESLKKIRTPQKRVTISVKDIRGVPTFRYLHMVIFRQTIIEDIVALLVEEGIPLPDGIEMTLAKIWLILDIPYSMRRIALMHDVSYWTDTDLIRAMTFFLRLDLRLTHPIYGSGSTSVRTVLLAQRSLSYLWRVLRREELRSPLEALRLIFLFKYHPPRQYDPRVKSILGIPLKRAGLLQYEFWGRKGRVQLLIGIEALVLREGIKRDMDLASGAFSFMAGGFFDQRTGEDIWPQGRLVMSEVPEAPSKEDSVVGSSGDYEHRYDDTETAWGTESETTMSVEENRKGSRELSEDDHKEDYQRVPKWWDSTSDDQTDEDE